MPEKIDVFWTRQARDDLLEIHAFIARDAPHTASAFVRRLRAAVDRLRTFPASGGMVPEAQDPEIREVLRGNYRIIYRFKGCSVEILTVYHGARLLDDDGW